MDKHADISTPAPFPPDRTLTIKSGQIVPTINIDWSTICDSRVPVKTKEGLTCGNIVDEYNDSFVLINFGSSRWREYLIPKSNVQRYDGKLLHLNINHELLMSYAY